MKKAKTVATLNLSRTTSHPAPPVLQNIHDISDGVPHSFLCAGVGEHFVVRISGPGLSVPKLGSTIRLT